MENRKVDKQKRTNKFPNDVFRGGGGGVVNIMQSYNIAREIDLPSICVELARTSVKQHRSVTQKYVNTTATKITDGLPIIITPILVKNITTLEYIMRNKQSIESGVHPSTFNQHHAEQEQAAEVVNLYDFVNGG